MGRRAATLLVLAALLSQGALGTLSTFYDPNFFSGTTRVDGVVPGTTVETFRYIVNNGAVVCRPGVAPDGNIVFTTSLGLLYKVTPAGAKVWEVYVGPSVSSPAFASDGTIYVGSNDFNLYAVTSDGDVVWRYTTGKPITASPTLKDDGSIVIGSRDHSLYVINSDGTLEWSYDTGNEIRGSASVLRDGSIAVGSMTGKLLRLSATGSLVWEYDAGSEIASKPLVQDVSIVIGTRKTSLVQGKIIAVKMDGTLRWSYTTAGDVDADPVQGNNSMAIAGSTDGRVYAIQADGTLLWRYVTGGATTSPTICQNLVVVASKNKFVYGLDQNGRFMFKHGPARRSLQSQPACVPGANILTGQLYYGSNDHSVYSVKFTV